MVGNMIWNIRQALLGLLLVAATFAPRPGDAAVIVTLTETTSGVALMGGGTLNLAALSYSDADPYGSAFMIPSSSQVTLGATNVGERFYTGYTGPSNFGSGGFHAATSASGDYFGIGDSNRLVVVNSYVSGDALSASAFFAGASFASLGVTPGTYAWTWGSGATADSFTLQIVPEPSGFLLLGFAVAAVMLGRRLATTPS